MDIKKIIQEELEDFQWVKDSLEADNNPLDGITFNYVAVNKSPQTLVYTIEDNGDDTVLVHFEGQHKPTPYSRDEVHDSFSSGKWVEV